MKLAEIPVRGRSPCLAKGCSACCHDNEMLLTESDVARIRAARPGVDFFFQNADGFLQLRTKDAPPAMPGAGRPCVFLAADGRCTVHDVRPEGCRLYPAVWDAEAERAILDGEYCPHTDGFSLPSATRDAVRRLAGRLMSERDRRTGGP